MWLPPLLRQACPFRNPNRAPDNAGSYLGHPHQFSEHRVEMNGENGVLNSLVQHADPIAPRLTPATQLSFGWVGEKDNLPHRLGTIWGQRGQCGYNLRATRVVARCHAACGKPWGSHTFATQTPCE